MNDADMQRLVGKVHGYVQGVAFRHFTRKAAHRLGLTGFVRNEPDGSVTVVAEGDREQLQRLIEVLHEGPPAAAVRRVDVHWEAADGTFGRFSVEH
jgi:acylphosphatase